MKISNNFGGLSEIFGDIGKMFGMDDDKKTEFKGGADRVKNKGLTKRLERDKTFYRKAMPAPLEGSAPGIDTATNKTATVSGTIPDTGQGVNFFGYGANTNINRFSNTDSASVNTNTFATGSVKISGFTTFKKPLSESDYGEGNPDAAADASYYRNKLYTGRYGELYKTAIAGQQTNQVAFNPTSVQIAFGNDADNVLQGTGGEAPEKLKPTNPTPGASKPSDLGISSDPIGQIKRRLPSATETGNDLFLNKYVNTFANTLYSPRGELPIDGNLPHSFQTASQKWMSYNDKLQIIRSDQMLNSVPGQNTAEEDGDGVSDTKAGSAQGSVSSVASFEIRSQINSPTEIQSIRKFEKKDLSPILVSDSAYKKTFFKRRNEPGVHVSPILGNDFTESAEKKIKRADTTRNSDISSGTASQINAQQQSVKDGISSNSDIDKRVENSYHPQTEDLPSESEYPNAQTKGNPKNTTIFNLKGKLSDDAGDQTKKDFRFGGSGASGRFRTSTDDFKTRYETALTNLGIENQNANNDSAYYNDIKSIDLLNRLGVESAETKGKRSIGSNPDVGKDGSQTAGPNASTKTYEQKIVGNPYYLYNKKVPNYSKTGEPKVDNQKGGNLRIDNFNSKSVLDASNASLNEHPEWANEDFIPLYFHDLVNKKYIPFRSFINSLSDQSDAKYTATQYLGRADEVQIYNGFTRTMSIDFNVVAFSVDELHPMWQRINYMVGLTKPAKYTDAGFIIPPLVKFNLGDIYRNQPVIITSVSTSIPQEATWELINNEKTNGDTSKSEYDFANGQIKKQNVKVARYPTMCNLSVSMTTMEKTAPETIQNHFGTLPENSGGSFVYDTFNKDLTSYPEKTTAEATV